MNPISVAVKRPLALSSLAAALVLISYQSASAQSWVSGAAVTPRPLITQPVDESQLTVLKGNTHPLARPEFDLGAAPASLPMQRMLLVLKRSLEQEYALRTLLDHQQDKHSPAYHKWLEPEEFGKQFGPTDADMQIIISWLQSHGFQVGTTKGRSVLEFSGTAGQVQEAFHTSIHKYIANGEQHWANANDPSIPTALTPAVAGVKTLHDFLKQPMIHVVDKDIRAKLVAKSRPQFTASNGLHALAPEDYGIIYSGTPAALNGIDGTGITVAIVARSNLFNDGSGDGSDVVQFRSVFGLPGNGLNIILNGPDPGDLGGDDEAEATLDSSWSGALATGATLDFVVSASTSTTDGVDLSELYIIENNLGNVMTESFGLCENDVGSSDQQAISLLAEQAAAQGITYMVSTGDTGAEGCDNLSETVAQGGIFVNVLASTPFNVAVGGTLFNEDGQNATYWNTTNDSFLGSAKSYIPEDVWNETCTTQCQPGQPPLAAGGGGASIYAAKPSWQFGPSGIPNDGARDLPDVSLTAAGHDPYLLCLEGSCVPNSQGEIFFEGVEGTSASAPSFAGMMALVDEEMSQLPSNEPNTSSRQGQANYVLYQLLLAQQNAGTACNASTTPLPNSSCVFNDVTVGNNSVPGEPGYPDGVYSSGVGYDQASGLGSVNVVNLLDAWAAATFKATITTLTLDNTASGNTTPVTITHGTSVPVNVTVTSSAGTPSGDVSLIAGISDGGAPSGETGVAEFTLGSGTAAGATNLLPGGTYTVTAHYAGAVVANPTTTFAPSDSAPPGVLVTVSPEGSTTALSGPFTLDQNGEYTVPFTTAPFGTPVLLSATVMGTPNVGAPTGTITFTTTAGTIPNNSAPSLNGQGTASLISNPSLLNGPTVPFDAGTYAISASYSGDASFEPSSSTSPQTFTITPGFFPSIASGASAVVSAPGGSATVSFSVVNSSGFSGTISLACSNLPTGAACKFSPASVSANGTFTTTPGTITVTTTAVSTAALYSPGRRLLPRWLVVSGFALFSILVIVNPNRSRVPRSLLLLLSLILLLPGCGGGGGSSSSTPPPPPPSTSVGTYNITVTATSGPITSTTGFTLIVQ
jgi:hypothetical protein